MFNKKTVLPILAMSLLPTIVSAASDNPWYVGVSVESADVDDINTESTAAVAGVVRRIDVESDSDTGFAVKVGKTLFTSENGNEFSLELSYASSDHDVENIAFMGNDFLASDGRSEGSIEIDTLLLRAVYQFDLGSVKPYVGLGIGEVDLTVDGRYAASVGSTGQAVPPFITGDDSATAVQYRLGVEYSISSNMGVFIEYTATDVDDIEFSRRGGGPGGLATTTQEGDFDIDTFGIGLNYRF